MSSHVPDQIDFSQEEEKMLRLWKELDAFKTSLKQSKDRPRLVKTRSSGRTLGGLQVRVPFWLDFFFDLRFIVSYL